MKNKEFKVKTEYAKATNGEVVHVSSQLASKTENFTCVHCCGVLFYRSGSYTPHFVHKNLENCSNETIIHFVAKTKLKEIYNKKAQLPINYSCDMCGKNMERSVYDFINRGVAENEIQHITGIRPDVSINDGKEFIGCLEVKVTHFVDNSKREILNRHPWLEVDGQTLLKWSLSGGKLEWIGGSIIDGLDKLCQSCDEKRQKEEEEEENEWRRKEEEKVKKFKLVEREYKKNIKKLEKSYAKKLLNLLLSVPQTDVNFTVDGARIVACGSGQSVNLNIKDRSNRFRVELSSSNNYRWDDLVFDNLSEIDIVIPGEYSDRLYQSIKDGKDFDIEELFNEPEVKKYLPSLISEINTLLIEKFEALNIIKLVESAGFAFEYCYIFADSADNFIINRPQTKLLGIGWGLKFSKKEDNILVFMTSHSRKITIKVDNRETRKFSSIDFAIPFLKDLGSE